MSTTSRRTLMAATARGSAMAAPGLVRAADPAPGGDRAAADPGPRNFKANTPAQLVADHLHLDEQMLRALPEDKRPVLSA